MFSQLDRESMDYLSIALFLPNQSIKTLSNLCVTIASRCEDKVVEQKTFWVLFDAGSCIKSSFWKCSWLEEISAVGQCVGRALKIKAPKCFPQTVLLSSLTKGNNISAWHKTGCTSSFNSVLEFLLVRETLWQYTTTIWLSEWRKKKRENPA